MKMQGIGIPCNPVTEMCFLEKQLLSFLILSRELGTDLDSEHMMVKEVRSLTLQVQHSGGLGKKIQANPGCWEGGKKWDKEEGRKNRREGTGEGRREKNRKRKETTSLVNREREGN